MSSILIASFASILVLGSYALYVRDVLRRGVKPHQYTFGIWTLLAVILTVNQFKNGGGASTIFFVVTLILLLVIFILSLKYGEKGSNKLDYFCLIFSVALFIYWLLTFDSKSSTYLAVCIDSIAVLPTIYKTYLKPETETYLPWVLSSVAAFITIFSLDTFSLVLLAYPLYVAIADGSIAGIKFLRRNG